MSQQLARCTLTERQNPPGTVVTMPRGTIKRIHIDQHRIRANKKKSEDLEPVITVQWKNRSYKVRTISINGPSRVIYSPFKALSCGAHVWVETEDEVTVVC